MSFRATCPQCRADVTLGDDQRGKKVRCKKCQTVFAAGAAAPLEVELVEPAPSKRSPNGVRKAPAQPVEVVVVERTAEQRVKAAPPAAVAKKGPVSPGPRRRGEDEEDARPAKKGGKQAAKGGSSMLIVGVVLGLVLLGGGAIAVVIAMSGPPSANSQVTSSGDTNSGGSGGPAFGAAGQAAGDGTEPGGIVPPKPGGKATPAGTSSDKDKDKGKAGPRDPSAGVLPEAVVEKIKKSTVYIRVTMANGSVSQGSGFFAIRDDVVLTNAHVLGMLKPDSRPPKEIEVVVNHNVPGQEKRVGAERLGVDRISDLAVLRVGGGGMPPPLEVTSARELKETQDVFVVGFPRGVGPGGASKNVSIAQGKVSSLELDAFGELRSVKMNSDMQPGNSGGPVVDANGNVVGVSVRGIKGTRINWAVPGEHVHNVLKGRSSHITFGYPAKEGNAVKVPVTVHMIDPMNRVNDPALEVWTGDPTELRKPAQAAPPPRPGDSPRQKVPVLYVRPTAAGEVTLPAVPAGKAVWMQPTWTDTEGQRRWGAGQVYELKNLQPVERKPVTLAVNQQKGSRRDVILKVKDSFNIFDSEDKTDGDHRFSTETTLRETVEAANAQGATLSLKYRKFEKTLVVDAAAIPKPDDVQKAIDLLLLPSVSAVVQVDAQGTITGYQLKPPTDRNAALQAISLKERLKDLHEPVQLSLESMSVPLPGKLVQPGESWKGKRGLPIDTPDNKFEAGEMDMTYTYLGSRKNNGKDEAVIEMKGTVKGAPGKVEKLGGNASGIAVVDLATGLVIKGKANFQVDVSTKYKDIPVIAFGILEAEIERGL